MTDYIPGAHEVETFTGRFVDTRYPEARSIVLEDIAHALANICRYGGHCQRFYSVAEHAVFVSKRLERRGYAPHVQMAGLHHDDPEAYLGDIPRPTKSLLGRAYEILTDRMDRQIFKALFTDETGKVTVPGLTRQSFHEQAVKDADNWALFVEARHLLPSQGRTWDGHPEGRTWSAGQPARIVTPDYWYNGLDPMDAERQFLSRHEELTAR